MTGRRGLALIACTLLLVLLAAGAGTAAPPPTPFCNVCGDALEQSLEEEHPDLTVERSTATIAVHGNGSATWTVRNELADRATAEALADRPASREFGRYGPLGDARRLGASVENESTLVLRYRDPEFARRSAGDTLVSGGFTSAYGYGNVEGLGAERVTVVAPEGTRVDWTASAATVSNGGRRTTVTEWRGEGFVTFVPSERAGPESWSLLAVGAFVWPAYRANAIAMVPVQAAAFGLLGALFAGAYAEPWLPAARARRYGTLGLGLLAGATLAIGLYAVAAHATGLLPAATLPLAGWSTPSTVGAGLGGLAFAAVLRRGEQSGTASAGTLAAGVVASVAVAAVAAVGTAATTGLDPLRTGLWTATAATALLGFVPAGVAAARGRRLVGATVAGLALTVAIARTVPVGPAHFGALSMVPYGVSYAATIALVGAPLLVVGTAFGLQRAD